MAEAKRPKAVVHTSPKGVAVFPWLTKPDTKFKPDGEYRVDLKLSAEDSVEVLALISAEHDKNLAATKADPKYKGKKIKEADLPLKPVVDEEGNETGEYLLRVKMNAQFKDKDGKVIIAAPSFFDAKGNKTEPDTLWGGSIIRVAYTVVPFYTAIAGAGVSLRLRGVKIIKLSAGSGGASAESMGFGEEEDGYEADTFEGGGNSDEGGAVSAESEEF